MKRTGLTKRPHDWLCILGLLVWATGRLALGTTTYVDQAATGTDSGTSWANAYTNLQSALAVAASNDQVWVAQGAYYPTNDSTRSARFAPGTGVALYGGFTNGMTSLAERAWNTYVTVLNGDIQRDGDPTNNAYHVVWATNNVTLDGFTICNGYADGSETYGGGLVIYSNRNVAVQNCAFTNNAAINAGGAISVYSFNNSSNTVIDNCVFRNNKVTTGSAAGGGGALYVYDKDVAGTWTNVIRGCRFSGNWVNPATTTSGGGAFGTYSQSGTVRWSVSDCFFLSNTAYYGGAILMQWTGNYYVFSNCVFAANKTVNLGGAVHALNGVMGRAFDCIFSDNLSASSSGSAIDAAGFVGNGCVICGGGPCGVRIVTGGSLVLTNCLIVSHFSRVGGVSVINCNPVRLVNCTLAFNDSSRTNGGGAITISTCSNAVLENCILWKNSNSAAGATNVLNLTSTTTVSYVDIEGGFATTSWSNRVGGLLTEGAGNINTNPLFPDPLIGAWSADSVFDAENGQTLLTHSSASWSTNGLIAQLVKPSGSGYQYYIASNTATTIYMWGNAASAATNGAPYAIYDYHEKSCYGHWTMIGWTNDAVTSPCIDAGNPASDYALEPVYNGRRINMGAYGNTDEASRSFLASGAIFSFH